MTTKWCRLDKKWLSKFLPPLTVIIEILFFCKNNSDFFSIQTVTVAETITTEGYQMLQLASGESVSFFISLILNDYHVECMIMFVLMFVTEDQEIGNLQPDSAVPRGVKDRYGLKPKTSSRNLVNICLLHFKTLKQ